MYILFLPRAGLYVSFLPLANARDIKAYPWSKQYIHMASMNYFLIKQQTPTLFKGR